MLSYLSCPEPSWLNGPPEPRPCDYSGTCPHCETRFYYGKNAEIETSLCSCGKSRCCELCERCASCGDPVCPECKVGLEAGGADDRETAITCRACHLTYLETESDEPEADKSAVQAHPPVLHPIFAGIITRHLGVRA